jgi:nitroreductase/NAD-dependent dihydropyrimidine dehydrogenase PreA subunit
MKRDVHPPEVMQEKCVGCGLCTQVCPSFVLDIANGKAWVVREGWCIGCGHCGAVCPVEAISHDGIIAESHPQPAAHTATSPETLLLLLRERRSVRVYKNEPVSEEMLKQILEAGRYAPTGTNSQNVHYVVLSSPSEIRHLRDMVIAFYEKVFSRVRSRTGGLVFSLVAGRKAVEYLREFLPKVDYAGMQMAQGKDPLFYHAPAIVLTHAESWDTCSAFNCSVALYHSSLMAHTMGVGCCFNGFLVGAVNHDSAIKRFLDIPRDHRCFAGMTLGHQDVRYKRLVERKPLNVTWR